MTSQDDRELEGLPTSGSDRKRYRLSRTFRKQGSINDYIVTGDPEFKKVEHLVEIIWV